MGIRWRTTTYIYILKTKLLYRYQERSVWQPLLLGHSQSHRTGFKTWLMSCWFASLSELHDTPPTR